MSKVYIIWTPSVNLYGKAVKDSTPWEDDAIDLTEQTPDSPGVYLGDSDNPYVFVRAGATPVDTDTFLGDIRQFHYGTVERGDLYYMTRVHSWDWEHALLEDKVKALYSATRLIDNFNFVGNTTDDPDQRLQFPRTYCPCPSINEVGVTVINNSAGSEDCDDPLVVGASNLDPFGVPIEIETATYLIADALIGGRDPQADFESQNIKVETFGPVRTEFATDKGPMMHTANLIPSPAAWAQIQPFLEISTDFRVNKA